MLTTQRIDINGAKLGLFDGGNRNGEPVMFIHGTGTVGFPAAVQEPALADSYRLIHVHRRGFGQSDPADPPFSIEDNAADIRATLRHLGIDRAHFVSVSAGSIILLQYAHDFPETVHSLTLIEPPFPWICNPDPEYLASSEKAGMLYQAGDKAGALDAFATEVAGQDYVAQFDANLPDGWFDQWLSEIDTMAQVEVPALSQWTFSRGDATRITQPVLNVMGSDTRPYFKTCNETVQSWIPHAENVVLSNATHVPPVMNPRDFANIVAGFLSRHPIRAG
jgi:pimeloyl-ACP methyl ester carboxylesterase